MGVNNAALNMLRDFSSALVNSGNGTNIVSSPGYMEIGTGSYTFNAGSNALQTIFSGVALTSSDIVKSDKIVTYTGAWNSVQLSGATLKEMLLRAGSVTGAAGSAWIINAFSGTTFDGSKELNIDVDVQFST